MANTRLTKHGRGWAYRRFIPRDLQPYFGKTQWAHSFSGNVTFNDARRQAALLALAYDDQIEMLRDWISKLDADERAALLALSKVERAKIAEKLFANQLTAEEAEASRQLIDIMDRDLAKRDPHEVPRLPVKKEQQSKLAAEHDPAKKALELHDTRRTLSKLREAVGKRTQVGKFRELREGRGLGKLLAYANSDHEAGVSRIRLYLTRFGQHLGRDVEPGAVSLQDVVGWRDAMKEAGITPSNLRQHLNKIAALYANAVSDGHLEANPFRGVKVRGGPQKASEKKRAFTRTELRKFMAAAKKAKLPHFHLVARCVAYSGARSSEIADLRVDDVKKVEGVWCYDINDDHRTIKNNTSARVVPIASQVLKEVLALTKGRPGDAPLFEAIPRHKAGRGHAWQIVASEIVRGIRGDDTRLKAHGLRHMFTNLAENNGVDEAVAAYIEGHRTDKSVRSTVYKARPAMKRLKDGVATVAKVIDGMLI